MRDVDLSIFDRELKKGAAELLLLSLLDARPRHGYELGKLIEFRSGGRLVFHIDSLYPLLYRLEERGWIKGSWVEKAGEAAAASTASRRTAGGCWRASGRPGRPSSTPSASSPAKSRREYTRATAAAKSLTGGQEAFSKKKRIVS